MQPIHQGDGILYTDPSENRARQEFARKPRAMTVHEWLSDEGLRITVPWVVVAEFWRGRM